MDGHLSNVKMKDTQKIIAKLSIDIKHTCEFVPHLLNTCVNKDVHFIAKDFKPVDFEIRGEPLCWSFEARVTL